MNNGFHVQPRSRSKCIGLVLLVLTSTACGQSLDANNDIDCAEASAYFENAYKHSGDAHDEMVARTLQRWYSSVALKAVADGKTTIKALQQRDQWAASELPNNLSKTKATMQGCSNRLKTNPAFLSVATELSRPRTPDYP